MLEDVPCGRPQTFHHGPLVFLVIVHFAAVAALLGWVISYEAGLLAESAIVAAASGIVIAVVAYIALFGIWQGSFRYDWMPLYNVSTMVAKQGCSALLTSHTTKQ